MPETRVKKILSQLFNVPIDSINENSSADTIPAWTSLAHMNLVVALEEEFGVSFNDEQIIEMLNYPLVVITIKEALQTVQIA